MKDSLHSPSSWPDPWKTSRSTDIYGGQPPSEMLAGGPFGQSFNQIMTNFVGFNLPSNWGLFSNKYLNQPPVLSLIARVLTLVLVNFLTRFFVCWQCWIKWVELPPAVFVIYLAGGSSQKATQKNFNCTVYLFVCAILGEGNDSNCFQLECKDFASVW